MLIVLEIAPEMKGCTAAIMWMWLSTDSARLPVRPHGLAQSKTARCSGLRCGAPSKVMAPQQKLLAASISARAKPSAASSSKEGSSSAPGAIPSRSTQKSSPRVHLLNVNLMSNAEARAASTLASAVSSNPFAFKVSSLMPGTLKGAPGINHETLKAKGFDEAALATVEAAVSVVS